MTYPTIQFFEQKGILSCIDGTGTIEATAQKLAAVLGLDRKDDNRPKKC
jgi:hypothetical protein